MPRNPYYQGPLKPRALPQRMIPKLDIVRPGQGIAITACCLSLRMVSFDLHFLDRNTIPCAGKEFGCQVCQLGRTGSKPYGFVIAQMVESKKVFVMEWTEHAMVTCPNLVQLDGDLRGRWITVRRGPKSKRDRVTGELGKDKTTARLPEAPDIYAVLGRIWGLDPEWCQQFPQTLNPPERPQSDPGDEFIIR